jgi:hypothetical protein
MLPSLCLLAGVEPRYSAPSNSGLATALAGQSRLSCTTRGTSRLRACAATHFESEIILLYPCVQLLVVPLCAAAGTIPVMAAVKTSVSMMQQLQKASDNPRITSIALLYRVSCIVDCHKQLTDRVLHTRQHCTLTVASVSFPCHCCAGLTTSSWQSLLVWGSSSPQVQWRWLPPAQQLSSGCRCRASHAPRALCHAAAAAALNLPPEGAHHSY